MKITFTLKKVIEISKNFDKEKDVTTSISVYVTSSQVTNERRSIVIDPDGDSLADRLAMIGFEDCIVTWYYRYALSDKDHLLLVILDLDRQYGGEEECEKETQLS